MLNFHERRQRLRRGVAAGAFSLGMTDQRIRLIVREVSRVKLSECPAWPRFLTREHAAAYLGVSVDVFDDEVRRGVWPQPWGRGGRGGRLTWDIKLLDRAADRFAGIDGTGRPPPTPPAASIEEERARADAAFGPKRKPS